MADEIASLGFNIDLKSLEAAARSLEALAAAARGADNAARGLDGQNRNLRSSTERYRNAVSGASGATRRLHDDVSDLGDALKSATRKALGFAAAYASISKLEGLVDSGFAYNEQLEKAQLGIASVVASTLDLVDAQGKALGGQEKFNAAQKMSVEMAKALDVASMQSPAAYTDLLSSFQMLLAPASQLGLQWQDTLDITIKMSNVMSALGLDMERLDEETQAILTGANLTRSAVAARLGITKEEIEQWGKGEKLLENFQKRFEAFAYAGVAVEDTMEAVRAYYEDVIQNAAGDAATSLWDSMKEAMLEVADAFYEVDETSKEFRKTEEWQALSEVLDGIGAALGEHVVGATKSAVESVKALGQYIKEVGADSFLGDLGQAAKVAGMGIAALTLARKVDAQAMYERIRATMSERAALSASAQAELAAARAAQQQAAARLAAHQAALRGIIATRDATRAEQILAANLRSTTQLTNTLTAANERLAAAQRAATASSVVTAGVNGLKNALSGIVTMLGGPVGIALTAFTVGATALWTQIGKADSATQSLEKAQESWANVMKSCTDEAGKLKEGLDATQAKMVELAQADALKAWKDQLGEMTKALKGYMQEQEALKRVNSSFGAVGDFGSGTQEYGEELDRLIARLEQDGPAGTKKFTDTLADLHSRMTDAGLAGTEFGRMLEEMLRKTQASGQGVTTLAGQVEQLGGACSSTAVAAREMLDVLNAKVTGGLIEGLEKNVRGLKAELAGVGKSSALLELFPDTKPETLGKWQSAFNKGGMNQLVGAMGDAGNKYTEKDWQAIEKTLSLTKQYNELQIKVGEQARKNRQSASSGAKSAASAAGKAASAQESYRTKLAQTEAQAAKLEAQLGKNANSEQSLALERGRIEQEYQAELQKNAQERLKIGKQLGAEELAQYKTAQDKVALLERDLKLREAEKAAAQKNVQTTQSQLSFYKELGKLSGRHVDDLELQKTLIAAQAKQYREICGIAPQLVDEWERLALLQESNDPFDGAYRGLLKFSSEMADSGKQWEDISYNFAKNFTQATRNMFDEFIDTGKISFDGISKLFRQLLKDLAWQAIAQPVIMSIVGGASGGTVSASGSGAQTGAQAAARGGADLGGLASQAASMGAKYALNQIGGTSGIMGGIADTINSTVASWFPGTFQSTAGGFAGPIVNSAGTVVGTSQVLPTFTSALATPAIGMGIGAMASPFVNSLLGIQNNTGSQIGSLVGGGLGTLAMAAVPGLGWIGAGIAGIASLLGGGIGGLLGGVQEKKPPKLGIGMAANLWERPGERTLREDSGAAQYTDEKSYWAAAKTTNGATGQWELVETFGDVAERVLNSSWQIADSLGAVDKSMKEDYLGALKDLGPTILNETHQGSWINEDVINGAMYSFVRTAQNQMITALGDVSLKPLTRAADGLAVRTVEDMAGSFNNLIEYANISQFIEDEELKERFGEKAVEQIADALSDVSFEPLSKAADGFAVDTMDELAASLENMFALYDLSENIQDETIKKSFREWAQNQIASAFSDVDLSFLRVDFDKDSFEGMQQAYAATQAWKTVTQSIEDFLHPAGEVETALNAASDQFTQWVSNLRELGWQEEALAEIEARRADYMREYQRQLQSEMQQNLSLRLTSLKYGQDSFQYGYQSLRYQQNNELDSVKQKFGEKSSIYRTTVAAQKAEETQYRLNYLQQQRQLQLQKQIQAEQAAIQARQKSLQAEMSAKQQEISKSSQLAESFRRLADSLAEFRRELWSGEDNLTGSRYDEAYRQFDQLYGRAMAGDEDAYKELESKAGELLDLGRENLGAYEEYNDLFYDVDQKLKDAQANAEKQLAEADRQTAMLESELAALERQQEALNAELEALNAQTEALNSQLEQGETANLSLEQIDAGIAALEVALQMQTQELAKTYQNTFGPDWEGLFADVVSDRNMTGYLEKSNWTRDSLLKEISDKGLTPEQWYQQIGRVEGYTLSAAKTTNAEIDYRIGNLDKDIEFYLESNTQLVNTTLLTTLEQLYLEGELVSGLLATQQANWPAAFAHIDSAAGNIVSAIHSLAASIAAAIKAASKSENSSKSSSTSKRYASGGITPANELFMVGENGPELMMSPRQWGVLSNEASKALMQWQKPALPPIQVKEDSGPQLDAIREVLLMIAAYARQTMAKTDEAAWLARRSAEILRGWNQYGMPPVETQR